MVPKPVLSADLVASWLRNLAENPLEEEQEDDANASVGHPNPCLILSLEPNGVPRWWPATHPDTLEKLSPQVRSDWAFKFLAGQWDVDEEILRALPDTSRRELLAIYLLHTHADICRSGPLPGLDSV